MNSLLTCFRKSKCVYQYVFTGILAGVLFLIILTSCASIPQESVLLSEEMTSMIRSARASHLEMVNAYMAERRAKADSFMVQKWIPAFLDDFVGESGVLDSLDSVQTNREKGQLMLEFAEAGLDEIYAQRVGIMGALDEVERSLKDAIETHYADMLVVNQALTAHLRSAAEVTATRQELLEKLKIVPEKIVPLDKLNTVLEEIITFEQKVESISTLVDSAKTVIKGGK